MKFQPGESGNPATQFKHGQARHPHAGRPIGIVRLVREITHDGMDVVHFMQSIVNTNALRGWWPRPWSPSVAT